MGTYKSVDEVVENISDEKRKAATRECLRAHSIGANLFALRLAAGLTQEEVAKRMDAEKEDVLRIENSKDSEITISEFRKFLSAVGKSVDVKIYDSPLSFHGFNFCTETEAHG